MSKELIRLKNLVMEFDGERILDNINLYINDHEFLTLLGPSGCGKTTTLPHHWRVSDAYLRRCSLRRYAHERRPRL